jgi:hypothetical protein
MDHVGIILKLNEHLHNRLAEIRVSLTIVIKSVKRAALEIILVVDKVIGHSVLFKALDPAI